MVDERAMVASLPLISILLSTLILCTFLSLHQQHYLDVLRDLLPVQGRVKITCPILQVTGFVLASFTDVCAY